MGDQQSLIAESTPADGSADRILTCDQAVFTSIRTPTGEGYRIIAASPGVRADEKVEITRRSPSHGSLVASDGGEAVGLGSYVLGSGRRCVTYSCNAGYEHTARGGQRVYTQMVLLDQAGYRRFDADPVSVHAALADVLRTREPLLKPVPRLEPIPLRLPEVESDNEEAAPLGPKLPVSAEWVWPLAAALLEGRNLILVGVDDPLPLLQWALLCIPRNSREHVDLSVGLQFSPARQMNVVLLPKEDEQLKRRIAGRGIELRNSNNTPPTLPTSLEPWFNLLQRWWQENRRDEIVELTSRQHPDAGRYDLAGIAADCEEQDRLAQAHHEQRKRAESPTSAPDRRANRSVPTTDQPISVPGTKEPPRR